MLDEDIAGAKKSLEIAENYEKLINSEEKAYRYSMGGGREELGTYGEILSKILEGSISSTDLPQEVLEAVVKALGFESSGLTAE
jgi:hypothetical protein